MAGLFFKERGEGSPVILIHGFPFHQKIWDPFAEKLATSFKVLTVDLPGLGKSSLPPGKFTIDDVADHVISWAAEIKLENSVWVGHSLGGYVALAVAAKKPSLMSGLGLFHSTAFADAPEKKQSRDKVVEFIQSNGVTAFTSNFIAPLFASPGHPGIPYVREIAMQATSEAVVGYTRAMRDRKERLDVLRKMTVPVLFVTGARDPGIGAESIRKQASLCRSAEVHILEDVAHMGMFENEIFCLQIIRNFVQKCQLPGT